MEGAMLRANLWNKSVSRVELDQRARDARLRLERIERLLVLRAAVSDTWLGRVLWLFSFRSSGEGSRTRQTRGTLSNQRPHLPQIQEVWLEVCAALGLALHDEPSLGEVVVMVALRAALPSM
jgi:hypothetical protein